ncbi:hypothetical protein AgCh_009439 [Apium graveolens]
MQSKYEMSMMGELTYFFGLQVKQVSDGIFISQTKYIHDLFKKFDLMDCTSAKTPMATATKLELNTTEKFQADPRESHLVAIKRIFRYLKGTLKLFIWYPRDSGFDLTGNSDVEYIFLQVNAARNLVNFSALDESMLNSMGYALTTSKLSEIRRLGLRKEWSYLCDVVTKVFYGKISNFDSINISMLNMLCMLVTDNYFNFSDLVLFELGFKLGELNKRGKSVYYARFFMMLANHLIENIVIENPTNKLNCWVQERRKNADLKRADHHKEVALFYFPVMEGPQVSEVISTVSTLPTSHISLPSNIAMASVSMTKQMPTQATKSQISKSNSKKVPSGFFQKKPVAKSTKQKEGSVKVGEKGEGQGENQRNPKDKAGEKRVPKPSHTTVSKQTVVVNKEISSLLVSSSQKDGTHTVQTGVKDPITAPSQSQIDVAPVNVESQPKSLIIEAPHTPNSPTYSLDVDMINTSLPNSTSLTLLEKPKIQASEHHLLDDLLAHLPFLSETVEIFVPKLSSICTESTIVSTPNSFISSIPMDIHHPSSSDYIPMDKLDSSHPSDSHTTVPMDIPHPSGVSTQLKVSSILTSAEDLVVIQSLLGLRKGSELSECLGCSQEKRERKSELIQSIFSGLEKVSERSPTLDGEGLTGAFSPTAASINVKSDYEATPKVHELEISGLEPQQGFRYMPSAAFPHPGISICFKWVSLNPYARALLSLPSPSSGYGRRRRRNREEGISNNMFYYGTANDVHIDLLCTSASSIG